MCGPDHYMQFHPDLLRELIHEQSSCLIIRRRHDLVNGDNRNPIIPHNGSQVEPEGRGSEGEIEQGLIWVDPSSAKMG